MLTFTELKEQAKNLSPEEKRILRQEVLRPQGVKGSELNERLKEFKGKLNLSSADYEKMMAIIEEDCRSVSKDD